MNLDIKQAEAVIQLHDIARFVERNFDADNIALQIREAAHKVDQAKPKDISGTSK